MEDDLDVEIDNEEGEEWSLEKLEMVRKFTEATAKKRSPKRKLKNILLSIQYQLDNILDK